LSSKKEQSSSSASDGDETNKTKSPICMCTPASDITFLAGVPVYIREEAEEEDATSERPRPCQAAGGSHAYLFMYVRTYKCVQHVFIYVFCTYTLCSWGTMNLLMRLSVSLREEDAQNAPDAHTLGNF
jgi:hypothetical protein